MSTQQIRRCVLVVVGIMLCANGCGMGPLPIAQSAASLAAPDPRAVLVRGLEQDARVLAEEIGVRDSADPQATRAAVQYIERAFRSIGDRVELQPYTVEGVVHHNVCLEFIGATHPDEIVVVGAWPPS